MITVPKKVEYAIVFMAYLSRKQDNSVSLTDAARVLKLPQRFLAQIATKLKQKELILSKEGKGGGYFLEKSLEDISVYDLIEALDENKRLVECLDDGDSCGRGGDCKLKKVWTRIENSLVFELKKIKLSEV